MAWSSPVWVEWVEWREGVFSTSRGVHSTQAEQGSAGRIPRQYPPVRSYTEVTASGTGAENRTEIHESLDKGDRRSGR